MAREDARTALRNAALELFAEKGFDASSTAEIAARAGVTERTLFRIFVDKREVLFDDEATGCDILLAAVAAVAAVADAPPSCKALDALFWAFRAFAPTLVERRPYTQPRFAIVSSTPALLERELAKQMALTEAMAAALRSRGASPLSAALAARIGMAAFSDAIESWFADSGCDYVGRLDRSRGELKRLVDATA